MKTNNILSFDGFYGENILNLSQDFLKVEALEIRSKIFNWEIAEHVHNNLFQLFFIVSGKGILYSEKKEFPIQGFDIIYIPSNTLHGFRFDDHISGHVISANDTYFDAILKSLPEINLRLDRLQVLKLATLENYERFDFFLKELINEIETDLEYRKEFIGNIFSILLIKIYRFLETHNHLAQKSDNRTLIIFKEFQILYKKSKNEKSIDAYAKELNITCVHLNRICKLVTKKTAIQVVTEYIINEAKKYLLNTNYSISEIAYFLNYNDPAYFTRIFKKITGASPSEFRK